MRLRHRKHATAVAVAVLGGLLSTGTPAAFAAPSDPGSPAVTTADRTDEGALPSVWPRPQTIKASGAAVPLSGEVTLVADAHADPYAVDAAGQVLRDAGVRTVHETLPGRGPVIRLGGNGAQDALRTLRAPSAPICRPAATGSRSARSRAAPPSPWTVSATTACSTPCRRCVSWSGTGASPGSPCGTGRAPPYAE